MKMNITNLICGSLAGALAVALLAGCGTTSGYKQADKTGAGMAAFREDITNAKKAIDGTMMALSRIAQSANTDPRPAFQQYAKSVANLESAANKAKDRGQEMKGRGEQFFKQWQQQLSEVKNPDIRSLAEQRKAKLQAAFDNIRKYTEPLKAQLDPWLSDLKDLETYLSNDLTITGVDAAKGLFEKTEREGMEVQKSMDALIAELNTVAATLTPAKVQSK